MKIRLEYIRAIKARNKLEKAAARLQKAEAMYADLKKAYFEAFPLTEDQKQALLEAFDRGDYFCCEDGLSVLSRLGFSDLWAERIQNWAHDRLGCRFDGSSFEDLYRKRYRQRLVEEGFKGQFSE